MDLDRVKDKIRKLFALAADDAHADGEITAAMSLAERAMQEYHLTQADLEVSRATVGTNAPREYVSRSSSGRWVKSLARWESTLSEAIRTLVGSVGLYRSHERKPTGTFGVHRSTPCIVWYGVAEDVELAVSLYDDWSHVIATIAQGRYGGAYRGDGSSYAYGFAKALWERACTESESRAAVVTPSTTAIVKVGSGSLADVLATRQQDARAWLATTGVHLCAPRGTRFTMKNPNAFEDGRSDGSRADFRATRKAKLT
jgi:hypothetical protein